MYLFSRCLYTKYYVIIELLFQNDVIFSYSQFFTKIRFGYFLYKYITLTFFDRSSSVLASDISNPSYMGVGYKSNNLADRGASNIMSPRTGPSSGHSSKDMTHGNLSPKKSSYDHATSSPTTKASTPM